MSDTGRVKTPHGLGRPGLVIIDDPRHEITQRSVIPMLVFGRLVCDCGWRSSRRGRPSTKAFAAGQHFADIAKATTVTRRWWVQVHLLRTNDYWKPQ